MKAATDGIDISAKNFSEEIKKLMSQKELSIYLPV